VFSVADNSADSDTYPTTFLRKNTKFLRKIASASGVMPQETATGVGVAMVPALLG
jgi:hypothetical protein